MAAPGSLRHGPGSRCSPPRTDPTQICPRAPSQSRKRQAASVPPAGAGRSSSSVPVGAASTCTSRRHSSPAAGDRHQSPLRSLPPENTGGLPVAGSSRLRGADSHFFLGGGTQKQKRRGHMTKTAWQKMLQLPEERGAQERLSCEENWLYQSWCDFSSCPGTAWLVAAGRAVPPRQRGTRRFSLQRDRCACSALDTGVNWALPVIFPFPELLQSQGDELAGGKSWLVVRFLTL